MSINLSVFIKLLIKYNQCYKSKLLINVQNKAVISILYSVKIKFHLIV